TEEETEGQDEGPPRDLPQLMFRGGDRAVMRATPRGGPEAMRVNEKYSSLPAAADRGVHIINIRAIDDLGYLQSEGTLLNSLGVDPDAKCKYGLYFQDGRRKVDYVLVYHYKKTGSHNILARVLHVDPPQGSQSLKQEPLPGKESSTDMTEFDHHEADKRARREEYESNLREAGLELEKDEDTKLHGIGFVKVHAPWNVLCREAEFLKLKMPTKKVYQIYQSRGLLAKLNSVVQKITEPIQPRVADYRAQNVKRLSFGFSREKKHLFDLTDKDSFFDSKTRSTIVSTGRGGPVANQGQGEARKKDSALLSKRRKCGQYGITSLLANGIYTAAYPLHDVSGLRVCSLQRRDLEDGWGRGAAFTSSPIVCFPLLGSRKYFGEKVGLYFAWLGVYTEMLIPASIVGIIVFLYGCLTVDDNIPSMEMCDHRNNITMCPLCDRTCSYWKLSSACATARASHFFDNPATVFFSIFMALWAATFMEHWKRKQMRLNYIWDLTGFEEEEAHPRAEYEAKVFKKSLQKESHQHREVGVRLPGRSRFIPRVTTFVGQEWPLPSLGAGGSAGGPWAPGRALPPRAPAPVAPPGRGPFPARPPGVPGLGRGGPPRGPGFTLSFFIFSPGHNFPGLVLGRPFPPHVARARRGLQGPLPAQWPVTPCLGPSLPANPVPSAAPLPSPPHTCFPLPRGLGPPPPHTRHRPPELSSSGAPVRGLLFPLGPSALNNIIEIRLDAKKFVTELRRPVAVRAKDIGNWYNILRCLAKLAVIINAFVISFTSDFIPRLVYRYMYSDDGSMHGFVNHTLSYFNVTDFQAGTAPNDPMELGYEVQICRYKDYREPPWSENKYELSKDFWTVLAVRLAFVIVFQNLVMFMSDFVDWIIPDIPKDISQQIHKEKVLLVDLFMKEEQGKQQMLDIWRDVLPSDSYNSHSPTSSRTQRSSLTSKGSYNVAV
uniref:Anoctamin n=1 Tax=Sarcophilus harrisii TaxID=9305 RepID=A0A7N4NI66_SARHA